MGNNNDEKDIISRMLPEDCLIIICSLTSPQDACRLSLVSSSFLSMADSDTVWEKFLPTDYSHILSRSSSIDINSPLKLFSSSKKDLFRLLSDSILIDEDKKSFALEKSSGKKCYILSARELSILYGNETDHWSWKSMEESRFSEVAELKTINRLEIEAKIRTKTLSPDTKYGAYLITKVTEQAFGLDAIPSETSIAGGEDGNRRIIQRKKVYLSQKDERRKQMENLFYRNRVEMMKGRVLEVMNEDENSVNGEEEEEEEGYPVKRKDGWTEMEIGEFLTDENEKDREITMTVMEIRGHQFKGGLIIEGIQIRPKHSSS